ncbi:MAG: UDP-glucose 4-epimerase [Marinobacter sp.]|nr:UDP-glucose 4-epimerase [Marinobacter sp.]
MSDGEDHFNNTTAARRCPKPWAKAIATYTPFPASLLQFAATLLGEKKAVAQRLLGSLQVDISHTQKCLNWTPPLTVKAGPSALFSQSTGLIL